MKTIKTLLLFILCLFSLVIDTKAEVFDVDTIMYNGNESNRINIVYMGDGYTISELDKYISDVNKSFSELFSTSPYQEYSEFFNVFAIKVISNESGAKHPNTASDCPTGSGYIPTSNPDNYFGSSFDRGSHRCLYITNLSRYYSTLADNFPQYDEVMVVVNTPYYGGCGGNAAVASTSSSGPQISIHELGHSFAGLGDEYSYGTCRSGEGPNYTHETDRNLIKWRNWIEEDTPIPTPYGQYCTKIGLYEGAHYCSSGVYRPKCNCMMRSLYQPFCEICQEHTILVSHDYIELIDSYSPVTDTIDACRSNSDLPFSASVVNNSPNTIKTTWLLDGILVESDTSGYTLPGSSLSPGIHELVLTATDTTESVKTGNIPVSSKRWYILKGTITSATLSPFPELCVNDPGYLLTGGYPAGGIYVGQHVVDNEFFPGNAGTGSYNIHYIYIDTVGCDYYVSHDIIVNPVAQTNNSIEICQGESILLGGEFQISSGIYYDTLQTIHGCDSVIITELTVHPAFETNHFTEICDGENILLGGELQTISGMYYDSLQTIHGCDSVIITELNVHPAFETNHFADICDGESILLGGEFQTNPGMYYDSLQTMHGCDSVIITELTVHPVFETNHFAELCEGESMLLGGEIQTSSGIYYDTLQTVLGCDSVIVTELNINNLPVIDLGNDTLINSTDTLILDAGDSFTDYLWSDGSDEHAISLYHLNAGEYEISVSVTDINNCSNSDTIVIHVVQSAPDLISDLSAGFNLEIYPNPTSDFLYIKSNSDVETGFTITLVDISGKTALMKKIERLDSGNPLELDLINLKPGIYMLRINNRNAFMIEKIVKE